jgi:hypothetical protein
VRQQVTSIIARPHLLERKWSAENERDRCISKLQLFRLKFVGGLFLRLSASVRARQVRALSCTRFNCETMKKLLIAAAAVALTTGCSNMGVNKGGITSTGVNLDQQNYQLIKGGARGDSYGFYLLGLLPIVSPTHAKAQSRLYESVGQRLEGRTIALMNQTEDRSAVYVILFSVPRLTVTADVIEFTEQRKQPATRETAQ